MSKQISRIVCFSGGHASSLTAIEVVRRHGNQNVILLNHDINPQYEHEDIKRFKKEIAEHLGIPITYANILGIENPESIPSQFQVCAIAKAFKVSNGKELCTNRLKTAPFINYMSANHRPGEAMIYYGFDKSESDRIIRRRKIIEAMGYQSAYPLAEWERTILSTTEIGIAPPATYTQFKHANCMGCLKAGKQHWYVIYCDRPDIWEEAKATEKYIGFTIHSDESLESLEGRFTPMKVAGVPATEHIDKNKFWAMVRKQVPGIHFQQVLDFKPCECLV